MVRVRDDKRDAILGAEQHYYQRCEDLWQEMIWELAMSLGLTEDTVEKVIEEGHRSHRVS